MRELTRNWGIEMIKYISTIPIVLLWANLGCNPSSNLNTALKTTDDEEGSDGADSELNTAVTLSTDPVVDTDSARIIKWNIVGSGSFTFGSPAETPCRAAYAEDEVEVALTRNFVMAETEITQYQWEQSGLQLPPQKVEGDNFPVTWINFYETLMFCNALSEKEGYDTCYNLSSCIGDFAVACPEGELFENGCGCTGDDCASSPNIYNCTGEIHKYDDWYECPGYRLPTTAEWEYAAKAGTTTTTFNGNVDNDAKYVCHEQSVLNDIAWYCHNSGNQLHPVAWKRPNPWGFYDMLGNVNEWVDYFTDGASLDYMDGHPGEDLVDPIGTRTGSDKDIRGYDYKAIGCRMRAARQMPVSPDTRGDDFGFRPVRTLFE